MKYIEHLVEPDRLLLTWQAQESERRSRYLVGELLRADDRVVLNYFKDTADYQEASAHGFKGYPAFQAKSGITTYDSHVMEAFVRRLPPRSRRDFPRFLELRGIQAGASMSDFALLGYAGAKLPDDGFELVHPFDDVDGPFEFIIEIAGFRYNSEVSADELAAGSPVSFARESTNAYDPRAIRIEMNGKKLGYVDRGRLGLFHSHLDAGDTIVGEVNRKNGTAERPLIYIYTAITPQ